MFIVCMSEKRRIFAASKYYHLIPEKIMENNDKNTAKRKLLRKVMEDKQAIINCIENGGDISETLKERGIKLA